MLASAVGPVLAVLLVTAVDLWVFLDARTRSEAGRPVSVSIGTFRIESPLAWFAACLLVFVLAVPTYLAARRA